MNLKKLMLSLIVFSLLLSPIQNKAIDNKDIAKITLGALSVILLYKNYAINQKLQELYRYAPKSTREQIENHSAQVKKCESEKDFLVISSFVTIFGFAGLMLIK